MVLAYTGFLCTILQCSFLASQCFIFQLKFTNPTTDDSTESPTCFHIYHLKNFSFVDTDLAIKFWKQQMVSLISCFLKTIDTGHFKTTILYFEQYKNHIQCNAQLYGK